jgi:hypothetical protein
VWSDSPKRCFLSTSVGGKLNTSVLTKMPRDCTALLDFQFPHDVQSSHWSGWIPYRDQYELDLLTSFPSMSQSGKQPKKGKAARRQANSASGGGVRLTQTIAPAAKFTGISGVGLQDMRLHSISYQAGWIRVGNGTLGATDTVYYFDNTTTYTISGHVPILPSDALLGQTYVDDVEKHYARKIVHKLFAHIVSVNPATSNSMMVAVAPIRGAGASAVSTANTDTTAGYTLADVTGAAGCQTCPSYGSMTIDLTDFVAGGAGAKENEFAIFNNTTGGTFTTNDGFVGLVPACLIVGGYNATTALRGTNTHAIFIQEVVSLLDFVGGASSSTAIGLARREIPESHPLFRNKSKTPGNPLRGTSSVRVDRPEWRPAYEKCDTCGIDDLTRHHSCGCKRDDGTYRSFCISPKLCFENRTCCGKNRWEVIEKPPQK